MPGRYALTLLLMLAPAGASAYGPSPAQRCTGVALQPGADLQRAVAASPAGTTFCLGAGVYARQTVIPKDNDRFIGRYGAVLDGGLSRPHAFAGTASGVVIENLKITRYAAAAQDSPVHGDDGHRWVVENNEISYNGGAGLDLGDHMRAVGNAIHHNLQIGVDMNGFGHHPGAGIVVEGNEIAFNNYTSAYDPGWEAGGTKFWNSIDLTVTNNYVHDNVGAGLWSDTDNIRTLYAGNRVENNQGPGILHEVSYDAVIRDNIVRNNGSAERHRCPGWLWCAGILISSSGAAKGSRGGIEIYGNTVVPGANGNGIGLVQNRRLRDAAEYGPHIVQNVHVHDNVVDLGTQRYGGRLNGNGAVSDDGETAIFTDRGNRFAHNVYCLRPGAKSFSWMDRQGGARYWRRMGQDRDGKFVYSDRGRSCFPLREGASNGQRNTAARN
ncbi:MAG TPA: right-handed parallel beta-helix repeat-containing protein [Stellaceae bacterium]|nr:right-handed parallel beta-helix repeat-containing protein [Stellaceae bacterium]